MNVRISFEPKYYTRTPEGKRNIECLDGEVSFYTQEDGEIGRIIVRVEDNGRSVRQCPMTDNKALPDFYSREMSHIVVDMVNVYIAALNNDPGFVWTTASKHNKYPTIVRHSSRQL